MLKQNLSVYKVYITIAEAGLGPMNWQDFQMRITPYETKGKYDLKNGDLIEAYVTPCNRNDKDHCNKPLCKGCLATVHGALYCSSFLKKIGEVEEKPKGKKPARRIELNWE